MACQERREARRILPKLMAFNRAIDSTVPFASKAEQQGLTNLIMSAGHQKAVRSTQLRSLEPDSFDIWFVAMDVFMVIL